MKKFSILLIVLAILVTGCKKAEVKEPVVREVPVIQEEVKEVETKEEVVEEIVYPEKSAIEKAREVSGLRIGRAYKEVGYYCGQRLKGKSDVDKSFTLFLLTGEIIDEDIVDEINIESKVRYNTESYYFGKKLVLKQAFINGFIEGYENLEKSSEIFDKNVQYSSTFLSNNIMDKYFYEVKEYHRQNIELMEKINELLNNYRISKSTQEEFLNIIDTASLTLRDIIFESGKENVDEFKNTFLHRYDEEIKKYLKDDLAENYRKERGTPFTNVYFDIENEIEDSIYSVKIPEKKRRKSKDDLFKIAHSLKMESHLAITKKEIVWEHVYKNALRYIGEDLAALLDTEGIEKEDIVPLLEKIANNLPNKNDIIMIKSGFVRIMGNRGARIFNDLKRSM